MSGARNSSYKIQGLVTLLYRYRLVSSSAASSTAGPSHSFQGYHRSFSSKLGYAGSYMNQGLRCLSSSTGETDRMPDADKVKDEGKKVQPKLPVVSTWVKWLLGSILSILLPFWKQKWERLGEIEDTVEKVVEEVEIVAEVVENVAEVAEKVSSEVAEKLPDNNKIKEAVVAAEHIARATAQEAKLAQDFIHKVTEMKQELKEMETIAEPLIDTIVEPPSTKVA